MAGTQPMDTRRGLQEEQHLKSPQLPTVRSSHSPVTRLEQDGLVVEHRESETSADLPLPGSAWRLLPCTAAENQISGDSQLSRTGDCHQHRVQDSPGAQPLRTPEGSTRKGWPRRHQGWPRRTQKVATSPAMPGAHTRSHWGRHCSTPSRGTSPDQLLTKRSALGW